MALMQSGTGAALSLGVEYMRGQDVSPGRALLGGVAGAADYYAKTMLLPKLGIDPNNMYATQLGGAVAGGAAYYLMAKMVGLTASPFDDLLSGAAIAVGSDVALKYASPYFRARKNDDSTTSMPAYSYGPSYPTASYY